MLMFVVCVGFFIFICLFVFVYLDNPFVLVAVQRIQLGKKNLIHRIYSVHYLHGPIKKINYK